jgi:hypothetical protein
MHHLMKTSIMVTDKSLYRLFIEMQPDKESKQEAIEFCHRLQQGNGFCKPDESGATPDDGSMAR